MHCSYLICNYFAVPDLQFIGTCCSRFGFCCCLDAAVASSASGSRNHPPAVGTTAQPYTAGRLPFIVTAVRKSTSEVPLRFIDALRFALDIVRSQPRTASLLSGNSVLRTDFFRRRLTPQRLPSVFQRFCAGLTRGEPSAELPAARVRRTVADSASSCCGLQISVNLPFPVSD